MESIPASGQPEQNRRPTVAKIAIFQSNNSVGQRGQGRSEILASAIRGPKIELILRS